MRIGAAASSGLVCGQALASMRDRGESLREIAWMADVSEKQARELIREAEAAPGAAGAPESETVRYGWWWIR
jgi:hypothetical protein